MCIPLPENYKGLALAREALFVFLLYVVLVCAMYAPVALTGKSLLPALYQPHGVVPEGVYNREGRLPINSFNVDLATPAYYELPVNKLVGDTYKNFELPLWNPYQAGGTPLSAQYSTRAFFPYQIIEDISPVKWWDFFMLGRLVFAGFFTYLFLRTAGGAGLGVFASFAGGVFYMFSGVFTWFINLEQLTNVAMVLPLVMLGVDSLAKTGRRIRSSSRAIALGAVFFALLLLAGQPEAALYATLLAFSYFIFMSISIHGASGALRQVLKFSLCYGLALGLSAFLLIPFLELAGQSFHIHQPGGPMGAQSLVNWRAIFAIVTPGGTEFPAEPSMALGAKLLAIDGRGNYFRFMPINGVWDTLGGYTGALPVLLLSFGVLAASFNKGWKSRGLIFFFAAFALFILLKNTGAPPFVWLGRLPLFDQVWSLRWAGPAWVFALCAGAAFGLEAFAFIRSGVTKATENNAAVSVYSKLKRTFDERTLYYSLVPFALLTGVYLIFAFLPACLLALKSAVSFSPAMAPYTAPALLASSAVTIITAAIAFILCACGDAKRRGWVLAVILLSLVELWWAVPRGYEAGWLYYKGAPFFIGSFAVFLFYKERYRLGAAFCVLFVAVFLVIDFYAPAGLPERQDPFKTPPYVEFIKSRHGEFRVAGAGGAIYPNFAGAVGLKDVRYVNSLLPEAFHAFRKERLHVDNIDESTDSALWFTGRPERSAAVSGPGRGRYALVSRPVADDIMKTIRNYSLLGVKYFIMPARPLALPDESGFKANYDLSAYGLAAIYDKEVRIFENPQALKRAFVVYDFLRAPSWMEAQNMAASGTFSLDKKAVLEQDARAPVAGGDGNYEVVFKRYGANRVELDVETGMDGLLVLTDVYYPGWKAEVNGAEAHIFRVDGLLRGVKVGKGKSKVIFSYFPLSFKAGVAVSAFSAAICACLFFAFKEKDAYGR